MALRPVSELGLVDVTDLASREDNDTPAEPTVTVKSSARRQAQTSKKPQRPGSSRGKGASSPKSDVNTRSGLRTLKREGSGDPSTTPAASRNAPVHEEPERSLVGATGVSIVSGALGVAGALLLGRHALRR
jgi:hypothetical protein